MKRGILTFFVVLLASTVAMGQITIDGDLFDWTDIEYADQGEIAEDLGDMETGSEFDLQGFKITSDSDYVYVMFEIDESTTFTSAYDNYEGYNAWELHLETNFADTAGLAWGGFWNIAPEYNIGLAGIINPDVETTEGTILPYTGDYAAAVWPDDYDSVGVVTGMVNGDDNAVEIAVPRDKINFGSDFRPMLYVVGDGVWANEEYFPDGVTQMEGDAYVLNYNFYTGASAVQVEGAGVNSEITIDGDLFDWTDIDYADQGEVAEDLGDMETGPEFDLQGFKITSDSDYVYVMFEIDESTTFTSAYDNYEGYNAYELHFDINVADTTGLAWGGFWNLSSDVNINLSPFANPDVDASTTTILNYTGDYSAAIWPDDYDSVGVAMGMVNGDDNAIEVAVPRDKINFGSDARPMLYVVGDGIWANEEYFPDGVTQMEGNAYVLNYNFYSGAATATQVGGDAATGVEDGFDNALADEFVLSQNYPNPFNPSTTISYTVPTESHVTLEVYNVLGEHVKTLVNSVQQPNNYSVVWNSTDGQGHMVSSGIYFYKLVSGNSVQVKKMVLVR